MRKLFVFIFVGLLLCALPFSATAATPPSPRTTAGLKEFANAYELKTTLDGAIYKIALPKFVYEGLVQSQRRDLAVFNADGQRYLAWGLLALGGLMPSGMAWKLMKTAPPNSVD